MKSNRDMGSQAQLANFGAVVSVRGSVVDVRFGGRLPSIFSVLRTGEERQIVIEVLAPRDAHHVRAIALTPTQGLARSMTVEDTGGPLKAPVGKGIQQPALEIWRGNEANVLKAQQALYHRARCNQAARRGEYSAAMEGASA